MDKRAFTLVELLVVISIIAILSALVLPAVFSARTAAEKARIDTELKQLEIAMQSFKEKFGDYPPDFANADRTEAASEVRRFIAKAWPRCERLPVDFQQTELPPEYNAGSAIVFWLGGNVNADGNFIGFSADQTNPFDVDSSGAPLATKSTSRIKPFFEFDITRVESPSDSLPTYWPKGVNHNTEIYKAGYVYFKAVDGGYDNRQFMSGAGRTAMRDGRVASTPWINPRSFQLRCCGLDGKMWGNQEDPPGTTHTDVWGTLFGASQTFPPYHQENYDDHVNFETGTLEDNLP